MNVILMQQGGGGGVAVIPILSFLPSLLMIVAMLRIWHWTAQIAKHVSEIATEARQTSGGEPE